MGISSNWAAKVGAMIALLVLVVTAQAATTLKIATLSPEGTGWMIELIGYGQDNVAAFAKLID